MLKKYLKHSRWFRILFSLPLAIRRKIVNSSAAAVESTYRRTVVGGQLIVSPTNIGGRFRISATSDLALTIVMSGAYESEVTNMLDRFPSISGSIVNVGANVGFYAVYFAKKFQGARKIYAIEPNSEAYSDLKWNIFENGCSGRVEAIQICIGETAGEVPFSVIAGLSEYSSIGEIVHPSASGLARDEIKVHLAPLDEAILTSSDVELIFVDTEGTELLVFKGAERMLRHTAPVLFFECGDPLLRKFGHSSKMLEEYLVSIGYTVRNALQPHLSLQHPFDGEAIAFPPNKMSLIETLRSGRG